MILSEEALMRIEASVFQLTNIRMLRGTRGWEMQIAVALEQGVYHKQAANVLRGIEPLVRNDDVAIEVGKPNAVMIEIEKREEAVP